VLHRLTLEIDQRCVRGMTRDPRPYRALMLRLSVPGRLGPRYFLLAFVDHDRTSDFSASSSSAGALKPSRLALPRRRDLYAMPSGNEHIVPPDTEYQVNNSVVSPIVRRVVADPALGSRRLVVHCYSSGIVRPIIRT